MEKTPKILVVDDEQQVREMTSEMLSSFGFDVVSASTTEEAVNLCSDSSIDMILTDIVMPDRNGLDLIIEIKKLYPEIPILAMSGGGGITGRYDYLEIAKLVGAKNIIRKPFNLIELKTAISDILGVSI